MLGTNDLKARFRASAADIADGVATLVQIVQSANVGSGGGQAQVLIISPPPLLAEVSMHGELFAGGRGTPTRIRERCRSTGRRVSGCQFGRRFQSSRWLSSGPGGSPAIGPSRHGQGTPDDADVDADTGDSCSLAVCGRGALLRPRLSRPLGRSMSQ